MKRHVIQPRGGWEEKVEKVGLTYHTIDGKLYWDESVCYELGAREVDQLESAGNAVHELCLKAIDEIVGKDRFEEMGIPAGMRTLIHNSWERKDFNLYGRFDFVFGPDGNPKMLEYNADTPTALVEAAVAQWFWLEETRPDCDQFNSLHERLIAAWKESGLKGTVHLGGVKEHLEDEQTVLYLQDTCHQAGLTAKHLYIDDVGFHRMTRRFVDLEEAEIETYFKLFPWEWMWASEYKEALGWDVCRFIEPPWKMLLSNKALLPLLWQLNPKHPNLLPAFFEEKQIQGHAKTYVRKPLYSREGSNVSIIHEGKPLVETEGEYGQEGFIYQAFAGQTAYNDFHPVLGVWMVGDEACGLGIREDQHLVTGNNSRFVPHFFK